MMTIIKLTRNVMAICGLVLIGLGIYFIMNGNISINKKVEAHNEVVIRDGQQVQSRSWNELLGYEFKIDLLDSTYIGR